MSGVWVITRTDPDGLSEPIAAVADVEEAKRLAVELGEGHSFARVPLLAPGATVLHTWCCRASVTGDRVTVHDPYRLAGAVRLIPAGDPVPESTQVVVDEEAARLSAQVTGEVVWHLKGYANTAVQARQVVRERAEELARGFGTP